MALPIPQKPWGKKKKTQLALSTFGWIKENTVQWTGREERVQYARTYNGLFDSVPCAFFFRACSKRELRHYSWPEYFNQSQRGWQNIATHIWGDIKGWQTSNKMMQLKLLWEHCHVVTETRCSREFMPESGSRGKVFLVLFFHILWCGCIGGNKWFCFSLWLARKNKQRLN